jgi:hypothetical protein
MRYLKYLALLAQIIDAIENAQQGRIDVTIKGIKYKREIWDLHITGARRP